MNAIWPEVAEPDELSIKSGDYVSDAAHAFRQRLKAYMTASVKKKGKPAENKVEPPSVGTIWVAKFYPKWQATIIEHLATEYATGKEPLNSNLAAHFGKHPDLKKYQKKVMPFVSTIKARVARIGADKGLEKTSPFDEFGVLQANFNYLKNSLGVSILILDKN